METTDRVQRLIEDNRNAPADTLIRAIFEDPNFRVAWDDCDNTHLPDLRSALEHWYNLDELELKFVVVRGERVKRGWVYLIHQQRQDKPLIEDIADHYSWMSEDPQYKDALDYEKYPGYFTD